MFDILDPQQTAIMVLIGTIAGLAGGMLGIGGGIVMIPAMTILLHNQFGSESFHLYKLAAITTAAALSIPAVMRHLRQTAIVSSVLIPALPLAVIGIAIGMFCSGFFVEEQTEMLKKIFGVFLLLVVTFDFWQQWRTRNSALSANEPDKPGSAIEVSFFGGSFVGFPAGFIAALLGIGGGVWMVPYQRMVLGIPLPKAIANSSAIILGIATITSVSQAAVIHGHMGSLTVPFWSGYVLAAHLIPTALIGGWIGAGFAHKLPVKWLRLALQVLLVVAGIRLVAA